MNTSRREFLKHAGWTVLGSGLLVSVTGIFPRNAQASKGEGHLYAYVVDTGKCIGCGKCVRACRKENSVPAECYRTWVERYTLYEAGEPEVDSLHGGEHGFKPLEHKAALEKSFFVPKLCNHCKAPNCVQVCPVGATYVTKEGFVLVDEKQCVGCAYCIQACPYGARFMNPERRTADKCTWCYHRVTQGKNPACVGVCPAGARQFGRLDDPGSPVYKILKEQKLQVLKPETGNEPMTYYLGLDKEVR
ncbi:MAG: 4Fe-4S dicluster domain-containing protein [Pseudomonadota bacterium]